MSTSPVFTRLSATALIVIGLLSGPAIAQQDNAWQPKARQVIDQLCQHYAAADNYRVTITGQEKIKAGEKQIVNNMSIKLAFAKPYNYIVVDGEGKRAIWHYSDGMTDTEYRPKLKQYVNKPTPVVESVMMVRAARTVLGGALFEPEPAKALGRYIKQAAYEGTDSIDGGECHHLRLTIDAGQLDVWITTGDKPVVRKAVLDQAEAIKRAGRVGSRVITQEYKDWQFNADLPKGAFVFEAPKDVTLVNAFDPNADLLAEPAPAFELADLNGKTVKLADLKGKVVVLDFWATWCGPCVQAMPIYAEVTGALKDKGVVFYAVNLKEDAAKIKAFLEVNKLDVNVLLDSTGTVGKEYKAHAIPHSVIIDKEGNIAKVHTGLSPDLKQTLTEELKKVLGIEEPAEAPEEE